MKIELEGTEQ